MVSEFLGLSILSTILYNSKLRAVWALVLFRWSLSPKVSHEGLLVLSVSVLKGGGLLTRWDIE